MPRFLQWLYTTGLFSPRLLIGDHVRKVKTANFMRIALPPFLLLGGWLLVGDVRPLLPALVLPISAAITVLAHEYAPSRATLLNVLALLLLPLDVILATYLCALTGGFASPMLLAFAVTTTHHTLVRGAPQALVALVLGLVVGILLFRNPEHNGLLAYLGGSHSLEPGALQYVGAAALMMFVASIMRTLSKTSRMHDAAEGRAKAAVEQLRRFVPQKMVNAILEQEPRTPSAKRKRLVVVFSDIRNFTTLMDRLEPEESLEILNEYFGRMAQIVNETGGTLDKFMGDGLMAFFGDPEPVSSPSKRALLMARRMFEEVRVMADELRARGLGDFGVGVGIAEGYCTVGSVGSPDYMSYTALGRTVNLAARLQALAGPGEICVDGRAFAPLRDLFAEATPESAQLKGMPGESAVYRLPAGELGRPGMWEQLQPATADSKGA